MGIKNLNKYMKQHCCESIRNVTLKEMSGKKLVVDANIFVHRFRIDDALLENIYLMLSLFKTNSISALFVFDGKPPEEKQKTIHKRLCIKKNAKTKYNEMLSNDQDQDQIELCKNKLNSLRKRFIKVKNEDYDRVKRLIIAMGFSCFVAKGEADVICARMVIKNKAYACVSDDMDMFVYGSTRVLRNFKLHDQTMSLYETNKILEKLNMSIKEFRQICVMSGTDYQTCGKITLKNSFELFKIYQKKKEVQEMNDEVFAPDFYTWLHHNTDLYKINFNYDEMTDVCNMFEALTVQLPCISISTKNRDTDALREIMFYENFIFSTFEDNYT